MLDLTNVESQKTNTPLDGTYSLTVEKGEVRKSKAGHDYLSLALAVSSGERKGAKVFENFNLSHPKENVREIANRRLKSMLESTGTTKMQFSNMNEITEAVTGTTLEAQVVPDGDYSKIKSFIPCTNNPTHGTEIPF